jgi:CRISPR-associated protein Csm3
MSDKKYQLLKKIIIKGRVKVITGLHIGGSNNSLSIGGMDNAVIRNPIDNKPYIPGSSLKGKMRSLLELAYSNIIERSMGNVKYIGNDDPSLITTKLFGSAKGGESQRPSRIIVRDGMLLNSEDLSNTELLYTEGKTEAVIDRITAAAIPRQLERVPAGAEFSLNLVLNIIEDEGQSDEKELIQNLFKALQMVQDDYLGGSGSRGSGQVAFIIEEVYEKDAEFYTNNSKTVENKVTEYTENYIPESIEVKPKQTDNV